MPKDKKKKSGKDSLEFVRDEVHESNEIMSEMIRKDMGISK